MVPNPNEAAMAMIKRERRVIPCVVITLMPETAILANKKVEQPPRTGNGMLVKKAPNFPKIPYRNIQAAQAYPASLAATFVKEMMPILQGQSKR